MAIVLDKGRQQSKIDPSSPDRGLITGVGSPEGIVRARVGTLYTRTDGGTNTTLYVKEAGNGNTGWVAK